MGILSKVNRYEAGGKNKDVGNRKMKTGKNIRAVRKKTTPGVKSAAGHERRGSLRHAENAGQKAGLAIGTAIHNAVKIISNASCNLAEDLGRAGSEAGRAVDGFIRRPKKHLHWGDK